MTTTDLKALAADGRPSLIGLDVDALAGCLAGLDVPERQQRLRARQLFHWIYQRGVTSFATMTTLPGDLRERLGAAYSIARPEIVAAQHSSDGTRKWLLRFADGQEVETVFIPEDDRGALCVSTQVGCTLTCSFCHTGTMPLVRNLGAAEIVAQMLIARDALDEWPTGRDGRLFTNIVIMMGMGEPLFNYDPTVAALRLAMDEHGLNLSRRRITVSTSGVVPRIEQLGAELGVGLAISLHAVRDELRDELVPINRKWNIATLLDAAAAIRRGGRSPSNMSCCRGSTTATPMRTSWSACSTGIPAKVNLIPFNPWPGAPFDCSSKNRIRAFAAISSRPLGTSRRCARRAAATSWPPAAS